MMIVREISKKEAVKVLKNKEIERRVYNDQNKYREIKDGKFIGGYVSDKLIGVICFYDRKNHESIHINVLKKYRSKYGFIFGKRSLKFRSGKPLFTNIQSVHKNVVKFALYSGFELWDIKKSEFTINDLPYENIIMRLRE